MKNSRLLPVFLVVFVDLLGFGLILPLLPYYADSYGATPFVIGLLTASYAAAQLLGAPLLGRLSDRYGRRPILLVSIFGTFVGFVLLGVAESLGAGLASWLGLLGSTNAFILSLLFISRVTDGLTGGNISVAQAYITDVTTAENRAQGLGMIGAAFGLGFIIGPATGGVLSAWGYAVPAFAAAGLALLNLVAVYFFLPESLTVEKLEEMAALEAEKPSFSLKALWQALNRPRVGPLLHIRFIFGLAFSF
ncbi:MAG: MFS transporter, partial [Anaerolineales bacterium]|nr:MFS transporter [Anaerolineales bacterium]